VDLLQPFAAAFYSLKNRQQISSLAVADLDSAEHLWGGPDNTRAFRNVLVGEPERRGEIWHAWISGGEIELSDEPCYYVLRHRSETNGRQLDRWALYCALDIQEQRLFIHEDVLSEGVERARQATEACETDMAPIFVGCEESFSRDLRSMLEESVDGKVPLMTFEESAKSRHDVWPLPVGTTTKAINAIFEGAPLFLLDGHHRLAAAKENHRLGMGDGKILACVCSMGPTDTLILPIHRAVHYERWMLAESLFADLVKAGCRVVELPDLKVAGISQYLESEQHAGPYCLVLHSHGNKIHLVHLPNQPKLPAQLSGLSVACLDYGVLGQHPQATSIPVASVEPILGQLAVDQAQAGFFLPASRPSEVRAIALSQLKMPRKSTRFVPKPALGLICRPWMNSG
jgi:hypothetical protein